jgi:SAM-dependent methyltransferase
MKESTVQKLLAVNREFYQTFAVHFSATRLRLQPGVKRILESLPTNANILDLGCGNGELARALVQRSYQGQYFGFDFSLELLKIAREGLDDLENFSFTLGDLTSPDWDLQICKVANMQMSIDEFDVVFSFAALHHLPGRDLHIQTFRKIYNLLVQDGRFIHSNWQFLNSDRLRKRIQPWEAIQLTSEDVEPGDYLLDWRQGGHGLRYIHQFSQHELISLAEKTGFNMVETFYSDGEGGNLGLYQVWEKVSKSDSPL